MRPSKELVQTKEIQALVYDSILLTYNRIKADEENSAGSANSASITKLVSSWIDLVDCVRRIRNRPLPGVITHVPIDRSAKIMSATKNQLIEIRSEIKSMDEEVEVSVTKPEPVNSTEPSRTNPDSKTIPTPHPSDQNAP